MSAKFLLIALVCVSVAQVYGNELNDAIDKALRNAETLNHKGEQRLHEATNSSNFNIHLIDRKARDILARAEGLQESLRASIRKVAELTEKKAKEAKSPESVFQCISMNERQANTDIQNNIQRFNLALNRLRSSSIAKVFTTGEAYEKMADQLALQYHDTVIGIGHCDNIACVNRVLDGFSSYLNGLFGSINRIDAQIGGFYKSFETESTSNYETTSEQVERIKSDGIRRIEKCL